MSVILGYCDPLSVAPGETIRFMVSTEGLKSYRADIVRLICADDSAEGPGYKEEVIETSVSGDHTGAFQPIRPGSLIQVPTNAQLDSMSSFHTGYHMADHPHQGPAGHRHALVRG